MSSILGLNGWQLGGFVLAGLLLNLTPGVDVLYVVTQSLKQGFRAGLVGGLGIAAGCFVHLGVAALGLGALLAASDWAFTLVKWVGAAYLLWLGLRAWWPVRHQSAVATTGTTESQTPTVSLRKVFWGGFLTNVLNPKVALFFLAFVPQFIGPGVSHKTLAFVLLGSIFNFNSVFVSAGYAGVAAYLGRRVNAVERGLGVIERLAGLLFIGFGLRLMLSPSR